MKSLLSTLVGGPRIDSTCFLLIPSVTWSTLAWVRRCPLHEKCYRDYFHRSHSPITKSKLPKIATTSLIMQPGSNSDRILRLTNDGARILSRCGTPPPRLLM